jgi:hypothetical protein
MCTVDGSEQQIALKGSGEGRTFKRKAGISWARKSIRSLSSAVVLEELRQALA